MPTLFRNAGEAEPICDDAKENADEDIIAPNTAPPAKGTPKRSPLTPAGPGPEVVGHRIKVYWPLDDAWYEGVVTEFDAAPHKHKGMDQQPTARTNGWGVRVWQLEPWMIPGWPTPLLACFLACSDRATAS